MRYRVDPTVRTFDDGRVVLGGSPIRMFRLSDAGARWFADVAEGRDQVVSADPATSQSTLLRRFADAGVVHPVPEPGAGRSEVAVSVVVPVRDRADQLDLLLTSLRAASAGHSSGRVAEVLVVDDGSVDAAAHAAVARRHGARLLRRDESGGPAAARHDGILAATNEVVAVVDSDVEVSAGWLDVLVAHLVDDHVGAVAARVCSAPSTGALAAHDEHRSPLDLGPTPARVAPGTRVAYVPAAAMLLRRDAYVEVGGFDPALRFGEDVDLVWRLRDAGWAVRHEPQVPVRHAPRVDATSWLRQRFDYGTSAAPLAARHPGALAPVRCSPWSLAVWALVLAGHPVVALLVAGGTAAALVRRLAGVPSVTAAELALRGHVGAGRMLARAVVRVWWPVALGGALVSRRVRRFVAAATVVAAADHWWNDGDPLPSRLVPIALLDDVAYGAGVWAGSLRQGDLEALVPEFRHDT